MKAQLDANQKAITEKIRALVPEATAIIFHGSRVHGLPSPTSDYDILVLTPRGVELKDRKRIQNTLSKFLPDVRLDVAFGSERWLRANLSREAHLRFWLENGIAGYGRVPRVRRFPPLYRDAIRTQLNWNEAHFLLVRGWGRTQAYRAQEYFRLLKHLTLVELALQQEFRNEVLWESIKLQIGDELFEILRNKSQHRRLRKPMVKRLERQVHRKFNQVRRALKASNLPSLESVPFKMR